MADTFTNTTLFFPGNIKKVASTIAVIAGASRVEGSSDTNTFTTTAITTTGSTLLVVGLSTYEATAVTFSDSKLNTWSPLTKQSTASNNAIQIYYCANPIVGTGHTFTATGVAGYEAIAVLGFSGTAASPFDQTNGTAVNTVTTIQPGNVAPTQDNELIITALSMGAAGAVSIDSGFSTPIQEPSTGSAHFGVALSYIIKGAGSSGVNVNPTWTNAASGTLAVSIATFKKA